MTEQKVENIDSEDAGYLLVKIEKSFDIKLGDTELMHIKTLGELCDHIVNKIELDNSHDCTKQQAFTNSVTQSPHYLVLTIKL